MSRRKLGVETNGGGGIKSRRIAQSTLSAVLSGARTLTKTQMIALAGFFHVSPAVFLPASGGGKMI
jgi:hypothetical protein